MLGEVSTNFMTDLVTAIQSAVSTSTMLSNLTSLIPAVGGVIVFAFTYRIVRKLLKGASKGKANI